MKNLNTRKWSTPVLISAGIFVSISGVLMFFGIRNPLEQAHEIIGLVFAIAIILHIVNNWNAFKYYFTQNFGLGIVGMVAIVSFTFIIVSASQGGGNLMMNIIHSVEGAPLTEVAPLLDQSTENIISSFKASGFVVENPEKSIEEIAAMNDVEPRELMQVIFNFVE